MEAVGRLAGGIAHDFNNILTAITGYADLLLEDLGATDPRRQDADEIHKAADRAAGLTRQLLAFSRQQVLQPTVLEVNKLVSDLEKMLRRLLGEDVELGTRLAPTTGRVKADPGQLEQVIMNLAVNARDAMPNGGKLTLETGNADLDEAYAADHYPARAGPFVLLAVSDTGVGMSDETQAHMFEPFFTTKEKGKGTGLGLATVYGIIKQSGGFIWVYSEVGHGTHVQALLAAGGGAGGAGVPARASACARGARNGDGLGGRDEAPVRSVARQVLERHGYTVLEAPSAEAALDLVTRYTGAIHLLLTDVVMPGLNGRELANRLAGLRPDARVIFMSGYTDDAVTRHGVLEPGSAYVQKPFTPDAIARKVREVLDRERGTGVTPVTPVAEGVAPGCHRVSIGPPNDHCEAAAPVARDADAELEALFAAINDVILVLDAEGRYVKIAPTNPSLLYRPAAELLGKTLRQVFDGPQAEQFMEYIRTALATRTTVHFEYSLSIEGRESGSPGDLAHEQRSGGAGRPGHHRSQTGGRAAARERAAVPRAGRALE